VKSYGNSEANVVRGRSRTPGLSSGRMPMAIRSSITGKRIHAASIIRDEEDRQWQNPSRDIKTLYRRFHR
jgi:hypothetical protein